MIVNCLCFTTLGANVNHVDESSIISLATHFLRQRAETERLNQFYDLEQYFYKNTDAQSHKILASHLDTFVETIDAYRTHRAFVGKTLTDFVTEYQVKDLIINGSEASVNIQEIVQFLIVEGNGMPSTYIEDYILSFPKIGSQWLISDIQR